MNSDPVELALREVTETKRLLEALILSSESFDYPRAKVTLQELQLKIQSLGRVAAELADRRDRMANCIIPFPFASVSGIPIR